MDDDWDNDDFEVALPAPGGDSQVAWDDEEEFEPTPLAPEHGSSPKLSKDKAEKLAREQAAARARAIENALEDEETAGEKRLRQRQEVEDADHELADELFASASLNEDPRTVVVQGVAGYALKNLKDHMALAHDIFDVFEKKKSKPNFRVKFLKELLKKVELALTAEDCDEIIGLMTTAKAAIEKAKKQPTAKKESKIKKGKSKKEEKAEVQQHADLFGGFVEDEYEDYQAEYDDFY